MPYDAFNDLAAQLVAAGLPIPTPLRNAMAGEFKPLALDTREVWPVWASERDYSEGQIATLMRAVGRLVRHPSYIEALATDLSERVDNNGDPVERVRPEDRVAAAMLMLQRATKEARKAAGSAKPPAPTRPPQAAAAKRPIITLSSRPSPIGPAVRPGELTPPTTTIAEAGLSAQLKVQNS